MIQGDSGGVCKCVCVGGGGGGQGRGAVNMVFNVHRKGTAY